MEEVEVEAAMEKKKKVLVIKTVTQAKRSQV